MKKNIGENNGKACVKDRQALHIKQMWFEQKRSIKEIQNFYDLKYNTIWRIIHNRYKHLDYLCSRSLNKAKK